MIDRRTMIGSTLLSLLSGKSSLKPDESPKKETPTVQPGNPIVGGTTLRIPAIASPGFISGSTGWTINADGTAEFNGLTLHGTLVLGTGTNNVIIADFSRRAIFVYDNNGHLTESIAPSSGTDSFGNAYKSGFTSYLGTNILQTGQLDSGIASFTNGNSANIGGTVQEVQGVGPGSNQPALELNSGHNSSQGVRLRLIGDDTGATATPFFQSFHDNASTDIDWIHTGIIKYGDPGTLAAETWHALPLAANWINQGAPFGNGSYKRMPDGTISFTGAISWTAAASNAPVQVCTALPVGYRPQNQKRCITMSMPNNTTTPQVESIDIHTDGTVWITSFANGTGPVTPITLDNVRYPIDG